MPSTSAASEEEKVQGRSFRTDLEALVCSRGVGVLEPHKVGPTRQSRIPVYDYLRPPGPLAGQFGA